MPRAREPPRAGRSLILKVFGSQFGLPNPGLLPTRREREEQFAMVQRAVTDLEQRGCTADDQVAATRSAGAPATRIRLAASPGMLCWP